jgi:heat-inducible transcriptional repressor
MRKVNSEYRKKIILKAVVDSYIHTAEPVGSNTLDARCNLGLSPATIRQAMAELERLGYISQPHTSAGRVPTDKGYRYYVDHLLEEREQVIHEEERERLEKKFRASLRQIRDMEELINEAVKFLSLVVRQAGVAICPRLRKSQFKYLQLIPIDHQKVRVILLTDTGGVRSFIIDAAGFKNYSGLNRLVRFLNQELEDKDLNRLDIHLLRKLEMKRDTLIEKSIERTQTLQMSIPGENTQKARRIFSALLVLMATLIEENGRLD